MALIMRINPRDSKGPVQFWSAPAKRSGDGALDDHGTLTDRPTLSLLFWLSHAAGRQVYDLPSKLS